MGILNGIEDQKLLCLVQDNFLTQHVLEPTRATRVLYIVLSSQKELVYNSLQAYVAFSRFDKLLGRFLAPMSKRI